MIDSFGMKTSVSLASSRSVPPYVRLANELRERIVSQELSPGDYIGTELQIAKDSKRSRMTVRRSIQVLMNEGLLERRPGRGVFIREKGHKTRCIHLLAGNLIWAPAVHVSHAVQDIARQSGIDVTLRDACGSVEENVSFIRKLPKSDLDGAIIMSQHCPSFNNALACLIAADFLFVVVDQDLRDIEAPSVLSDNLSGGKMAAEALIRANHTRIAFIGDLGADTSAARLAGVREACAEASVPAPLAFDIECNDRFADWTPNVRRNILKLLQCNPSPTGLVCSCDAVARLVYRCLAEQGLSIPKDMSIIGFDDDPIAEWLTPALTTIRQDFDQIGRVAMKLLEDRIAHPNAPIRHEKIPVTLVERASVAPPPENA